MDSSSHGDLPTLHADTENLQRQLEQWFQRVKTTASRRDDQADRKHDGAMVIRGK